jgi:hypothetical protein
MESAQQYRRRAAHLRQLSSIESDVTLRQQLNLVALGYDDFAEQLEEREMRNAMPTSGGDDSSSR